MRAGSAPLDAASGLASIRAPAEEDRFGVAKTGGCLQVIAETNDAGNRRQQVAEHRVLGSTLIN